MPLLLLSLTLNPHSLTTTTPHAPPHQGHVVQVSEHNATRTQHGRFLLGNAFVCAAVGGVFVVDDSAAMPMGGAAFMLDQVGCSPFPHD